MPVAMAVAFHPVVAVAVDEVVDAALVVVLVALVVVKSPLGATANQILTLCIVARGLFHAHFTVVEAAT